jgi:hypothetical protein
MKHLVLPLAFQAIRDFALDIRMKTVMDKPKSAAANEVVPLKGEPIAAFDLNLHAGLLFQLAVVVANGLVVDLVAQPLGVHERPGAEETGILGLQVARIVAGGRR